MLTLSIYRCNPSVGESARFDEFEIEAEEKMTVLDALCAIQSEQDPTLAFRYSCRAGICGTCAMTVNGVPRWTCRLQLAKLRASIVKLEPLRHFPVIKDLAVDMDPFFGKMKAVMPQFVPKEDRQELVTLPPETRERRAIAPHLECIGCGACYAACSMVNLDPDYLGPAALNRAFTLIHDSRDGAREARLEVVDGEHGCWRCHTQATCMEVCPKTIDTTGAIGDLKRQLIRRRVGRLFRR
jgi:succinate dehydrogenase/fumarate reductase iron-sulfur protein